MVAPLGAMLVVLQVGYLVESTAGLWGDWWAALLAAGMAGKWAGSWAGDSAQCSVARLDGTSGALQVDLKAVMMAVSWVDLSG